MVRFAPVGSHADVSLIAPVGSHAHATCSRQFDRTAEKARVQVNGGQEVERSVS